MFVNLTISSSFSLRETKAYDILHRLRVKEIIKNKASFIIVLGVRIKGLKTKFNQKKIIEAVFIEEKLKLRNQILVKLGEFRRAKNELSEYEIKPEELLRQLNEKINRDFQDIKDIIGSLNEMEKEMCEIERDQDATLAALEESINFTNSLQAQLV